jgi:hypothetical protein
MAVPDAPLATKPCGLAPWHYRRTPGLELSHTQGGAPTRGRKRLDGLDLEACRLEAREPTETRAACVDGPDRDLQRVTYGAFHPARRHRRYLDTWEFYLVLTP